MLLRSTNILSILTISSVFLGGIYAYQQDQRQPIGERASVVVAQPQQQESKPKKKNKKKHKKDDAREPIGERAQVAPIVVAQPRQQEHQVVVNTPTPAPKKKEHKKDSSRASVWEKPHNVSSVDAQPKQQDRPVVVNTPTPAPKKKEHKKDKSREPIGERGQVAPIVVAQPRQQEHQVVVNTPAQVQKKSKKDKSRQTLGERPQRMPIVVAQPRQEIGPQISIQGSVSVPVSHQVVIPVEQGQRQVIGERARPIQNSPVAVKVYQPVIVDSPVVVPTPLQRSERPVISVGFGVAPVVVSQPQRHVIVPRPLPQVILIDRNSAAYPSAVLTPYFISKRGDTIQLDNGSSWSVRHRDRRTVRQWDNGDFIVIETGRFFSWSTYKLVNYTRGGTSVDVELNDPVCSGILSHWVAEVNPFEGYLRLQDGSIWRMNTSELLNWQVNDDVIIGLSKNFFSNNSSYVLINPRVKTRLVAVFSL